MNNKFRTILLTILLGAIGSGVWDLFLGDLVKGGIVGIVSLVGEFSDSYLNKLHRRIGYAPVESIIGFLPYLLLMLSLIVFPWVYLWKNIKLTKRVVSPINSAIAIAGIIILILYGSKLHQVTYTQGAILYIQRSMAILAPHLTESERLIMNSEYRAISTASAFYALYEKIEDKREELNIIFPMDFEPVGFDKDSPNK